MSFPSLTLLYGNRYCFECKPYKYRTEGYSCHQRHRIIKYLELEGAHKDRGVQFLDDYNCMFYHLKIVPLQLETRAQNSANYVMSSHQVHLTGTKGSKWLFIHVWFFAKFRYAKEEWGTFQIFWFIHTSYRKENFLGTLTNKGWLE